MSGERSDVSIWFCGFRLCALVAVCLATAPGWTACTQEPVVALGAVADADVTTDDDSTIDEAERERLFRELAERECREDQPVCGADGLTYRNYCQAVANGAQVLHPGPC